MACDQPIVPTLPLLGCCQVGAGAISLFSLHRGWLPIDAGQHFAVSGSVVTYCGAYQPPYRTLYLRLRSKITYVPIAQFGEDTAESIDTFGKWTGTTYTTETTRTPNFDNHRTSLGPIAGFLQRSRLVTCGPGYVKIEGDRAFNTAGPWTLVSYTEAWAEMPWTLDEAVDDMRLILDGISAWPTAASPFPGILSKNEYLIAPDGQPFLVDPGSSGNREASTEVFSFQGDFFPARIAGATQLRLQKMRDTGEFCKLEAELQRRPIALGGGFTLLNLYSCQPRVSLQGEPILPPTSAEWQPVWERYRQRRYIGAGELWFEVPPPARPACCE
jgi:hypothetical protein